jgi:hypothetical protein
VVTALGLLPFPLRELMEPPDGEGKEGGIEEGRKKMR